MSTEDPRQLSPIRVYRLLAGSAPASEDLAKTDALIAAVSSSRKPMLWHYGPTPADPDPGSMWHYGCGQRVDFFDGHAVCGCGAQACESPVDCGDDACQYRTGGSAPVSEEPTPNPLAHLPGMLEDARAYCLGRFNYEPGAYVSEEARQQHIDNDARSTATETRFAMPWNAGYARGISEGRRQAAEAVQKLRLRYLGSSAWGAIVAVVFDDVAEFVGPQEPAEEAAMSTHQPDYLAPPDVLRAAADAADDAICRRLDHHQVVALAADAVWRIAHERGHAEGLREAAAAVQRPCQLAYERGIAEGRRQATERFIGECSAAASGHRRAYRPGPPPHPPGTVDDRPRVLRSLHIAIGLELARNMASHRLLADGPWEPASCPTCSGPIRETVGMVCQTCGTDYAPPAAEQPDWRRPRRRGGHAAVGAAHRRDVRVEGLPLE